MILEIRAGTGGLEAALWAADLARMYQRYAENKGWKVKMEYGSHDDLGGLREARLRISGFSKSKNSPYQLLATEAGVHRVQRVPETEGSGRIHTSTATVAVLPEEGEEGEEGEKTHQSATKIEIKPSDVRMDTFRSGGPGGQHTNKVETGVRVTHILTGISVESTTERSQYQNRQVAMALLEHELRTRQAQALKKQQNQQRKQQIGTAERSEKIRTYNFPQDRVTDHRVGKSWHRLEDVLDGGLDKIVQTLQAY